jgi:hypothetical protein
MALPPTHKADHTPVLVLSYDSAWDKERIEYELGVIRGDVEADPARPVLYDSPSDHPVVRYHAGMSRCDLSTVSEYLDDEKGPVRFTLARLPLAEWGRVRAALERSKPDAQVLAVRLGLVAIDGADVPLSSARPLRDSDLERVRRLVSDAGIEELGSQVIHCSRELFDLEKKP